MKPSFTRIKEVVTVTTDGANALMDKGWVMLAVSEKGGEFHCCMGSRSRKTSSTVANETPSYEVIARLFKNLTPATPRSGYKDEIRRTYIADGLSDEDAEILARALRNGMTEYLRDAAIKMASEIRGGRA